MRMSEQDRDRQWARAMNQYSDFVAEFGQSYAQLLQQGWTYWQRMTEGAANTPGRQTAPADYGRVSRYPVAIDEPVVPIHYIDSIPLASRRAVLSTGDEVVVPFRFWRTQALRLAGRANLSRITEILKPHGESPVADANGDAQIHIFAPNYAGTSLGPIPAVFASIVVHDSHFCGTQYRADGGCLDGEFFWVYRTSNALNNRFKREIWGIHSEMAGVAFDYIGSAKGVALLESGQNALRLVWQNGSGWQDQVELPGEQRFTSVTPLPLRTHYLTRYRGSALRAGPARQEEALFVAGVDECWWNPATSFGRQLQDVEFEPVSWTFFTDYAGVVEIPSP